MQEPPITSGSSADHQSRYEPPQLPRNASDISNRRFRHRSEETRERDALCHLQAWADWYMPALMHNRPANFTHGRPPSGIEPCPDTSLAAYVQLVALRMKTRSCIATLTTSTTEYVLADMSQTSPLQRDDTSASSPTTWLGTCSFERSDGPGSDLVNEWRKARAGRRKPAKLDQYYTEKLTPHAYIIQDAYLDEQFSQAPLVRYAEWIRFYASVPLRSAQGSIIGSLTILDDSPRFGISTTEMVLLEDVADTVVQHLNATIVRERSHRSERLIQGLGLFTKGEGSLRDWWLAQDDNRTLNLGRNVEQGSEGDRQDRVNTEFGLQSLAGQESTQDGSTVQPLLGPDDLGSIADPDSEKAPVRSVDEAPLQIGKRDASAKSAADATFARASNLLRESLGCYGVLFLYQDSGGPIRRTDDESDTLSDYDSSGSRDRKHHGDSQGCQVQGFSTRIASSLGGHSNKSLPVLLSKSSLRRLIKRYPKGTIMHMDAEGQVLVGSEEDISTSSGPTTGHNKPSANYLKQAANVFKKIIRDARSVAFFPIWDEQNEYWRSCIFAWNQTTSFFDRGEVLTYLNTFSNSILAELSRQDTMASDKAKETFISSISHELRSPLHGILAGVEFLDETDLDRYQREMATSINTAGRVLLDTVDHILDYSKITNTIDRRPSRKFLKSSRGVMNEDREAGSTDLALLTEQVVEMCVNAHRSSVHPSYTARSANNLVETNKHTAPDPNIAFTLDIDHRANWVVDIAPGAWTRILTNLVGNALKYTHRGRITVRLECSGKVDQEHAGSDTVAIRLSVEDTGIGMSKVYQANNLFAAFQQEDPHSSGTGLGLHIVKEIVKSLGAELVLTSKKNHGTKIVLRLAARLTTSHAARTYESSLRKGVNETTKHLKVDELQLITLSTHSITSGDVHIDNLDDAVGKSVAKNASEWLGCKISFDTDSVNDPSTSICAITQQSLLAWKDGRIKNGADELRKAASECSHIFVLADSIQSVPLPLDFVTFAFTPVYIHQPIGPQKLLRAIVSAQDSIRTGRPNATLASRGAKSGKQSSEQTPSSHRRSASCITSERDDCHVIPADEPALLNVTQLHKTSPRQTTDSESSSPNHSTSTADLDSYNYAFSTANSSTALSATDTAPSTPSERNLVDGGRDGVLLVEDNEINMKLLVALMKKLGLTYHCAENGLEALSLYREMPTKIFLVLMDMSMPIMDGFTATMKIREMQRKCDLPKVFICALTGVINVDARERAFACGVDEFFPKPTRMLELKALVARARE